jgi:hypothetical protein
MRCRRNEHLDGVVSSSRLGESASKLEFRRRPNLSHDLVGHAADEIVRDLGAVRLGQKALDLSDGHALGVHGDELVVEAGEAARMIRDQDRLEHAVAIPGELDRQRPFLGEHRLAGTAIAVMV